MSSQAIHSDPPLPNFARPTRARISGRRSERRRAVDHLHSSPARFDVASDHTPEELSSARLLSAHPDLPSQTLVSAASESLRKILC